MGAKKRRTGKVVEITMSNNRNPADADDEQTTNHSKGTWLLGTPPIRADAVGGFSRIENVLNVAEI